MTAIVTRQRAAPGAKSDVYDCLVNVLTFCAWFKCLLCAFLTNFLITRSLFCIFFFVYAAIEIFSMNK